MTIHWRIGADCHVSFRQSLVDFCLSGAIDDHTSATCRLVREDHGHPRLTGDIDFLVRSHTRSIPNSDIALAALRL
jgi:hypothetical protein